MPFRSRRLCERRRRILGGFLAAGVLSACGRPEEPRHPLEGMAFPALALRGLDGEARSTGLLAGQPLVFNFWASWCPPCRGEMPDLDALGRRFVGRGLRVIGVAVDDDLNLVREFILQRQIGFEIWSDPGIRICRAPLGVQGIPSTYLVSRHGRIGRVVTGERRWDEEPARQWVQELLES